MKRTAIAIILLLAGAASLSAQSQYRLWPFSSLALNFSAGTDGLGFGAATELSRHLTLRGAFNMIPDIGGNKVIDIDSDRFWDVHGETGFKWKLSTRDISVMLDYAPLIGTPFRITAGFYSSFIVYNGSVLSDEIPGDARRWRVDLDGGRTVSLDTYGRFQAETLVNSFKPYLGIGWGRHVTYGGRVSVTVDAGAMYLGSSKVMAYDFLADEGGYVSCPVTSADFENIDGGAFDRWTGLMFWPVLKVGLNIRLL